MGRFTQGTYDTRKKRKGTIHTVTYRHGVLLGGHYLYKMKNGNMMEYTLEIFECKNSLHCYSDYSKPEKYEGYYTVL